MERCIFTPNATPNLSELVINLRRMEAMLHASFEKEFPNQVVSYGYVLWAFSFSPPIAISIGVYLGLQPCTSSALPFQS
jgi:hypothetical protein